MDKTKLFCLVRVGGVNWTGGKTRQFCPSQNALWTEFCLVST